MSYSIHDSSAGVVDESVLTKVDQNYRRKLLKGDNIWITPRNTLRTRPDIKVESGLPNAVDAVRFKGETVYLQRWEGVNNISIRSGLVGTTEGENPIPDTVIQAIQHVFDKKNITTPGDLTRELRYSYIRLGNKSVVSFKLPKQYTDREVDYIVFADGSNILNTYFTDSNLSGRLSSFTSTAANEGTWLVSNKSYLPTEMVYNPVDDNIILNMLGEIWVYDGESLSVSEGSPDVLTPQSVNRVLPDNVDFEGELPLIAQVVIYDTSGRSTTAAQSYIVEGDLSYITDIKNHEDSSALKNNTFLRSSLEYLKQNKDNIKFSLMELGEDVLNDASYFSLQGDDKRFFMADVKLTKNGEDVSSLDLLQKISGDTFIWATDGVWSEKEVRSNTTPKSLRYIERDDSRLDETNNRGSSYGSDGFVIVHQSPQSTDDQYLPYLGGSTVSSSAAIDNAFYRNLCTIKVTLNYSHKKVVDFMNSLRNNWISNFQSNGDRFGTDLLHNRSNLKTANNSAKEHIESVFTNHKFASGYPAGTAFIYTMFSPSILRRPSPKRLQSNTKVAATDGITIASNEGNQNNISLISWLDAIADSPRDYNPQYKKAVLSINRFSTQFKAYQFISENQKVGLINRNLVIGGENIHYSEFGKPVILNLAWKEYVRNNIYVSDSDPAYLRASGYGGEDVSNEERVVNNEPQQFELRDETVTNIALLDVRSDNEGVITTDKRLLRASGNLSGQLPVLTEIDDIGVDEGAITRYTGSLIHAQDGLIRQSIYSERIRGYVSNLINKQTKLAPVKDMVQLITKHRVILALHTDNTISCISLGSEMQVKGLTRWRAIVGATKFVKESEDKVLIVSADGAYNIDFSAEQEGKDWDGDIKTHIRPTPIRFNTDKYLSIMFPIPLASLAIGIVGDADVTINLINYPKYDPEGDDTQNAVVNVPTRGVSLGGQQDIVREVVNGVILVESLPSNSSKLPIIEIKGTGKVYEITGIDIMFKR